MQAEDIMFEKAILTIGFDIICPGHKGVNFLLPSNLLPSPGQQEKLIHVVNFWHLARSYLGLVGLFRV